MGYREDTKNAGCMYLAIGLIIVIIVLAMRLG